MSREPLKRARKVGGEVRADRAMQSRRVTQDRELTDSERVDLLRRKLFQTSLPDLPKVPGFHNCWLTTTNPQDPISGRLMLGYKLLRASDVPGFEYLEMKTGDYSGYIGVKEMLASRIPIHLYEAYMREVHHDAPTREEEAIYSTSMQVAEEAAQSAKRGGRMKAPIIEAGTEELGKAREAPLFSDEEG